MPIGSDTGRFTRGRRGPSQGSGASWISLAGDTAMKDTLLSGAVQFGELPPQDLYMTYDS